MFMSCVIARNTVTKQSVSNISPAICFSLTAKITKAIKIFIYRFRQLILSQLRLVLFKFIFVKKNLTLDDIYHKFVNSGL
jgi:hypothetical protein